MADINSLPNEVLVRIFQYYLETESQQNLLNQLSKVSRKWEDLCKDSSNFRTVDGTMPVGTIISLAKAGSLKKTTTLAFGIHKAKNKSPFNKSFENFYSHLPQLKSLNLAYICSDLDKKKEHSIFTELKDFCPDLCELILGSPEINCKARISDSIFTDFLLARGNKLTTLDFSHVNVPNIRKVITLVAKHCPNLENLIMQEMTNENLTITFSIQQLQVGCPKLKTLRLGFPIVFTEKCGLESPGFPHLEIFTYPYRDNLHFKDAVFTMILGKSPDLKILDIRGCQLLSVDAIYALPTTDLEQLYVSRARITQKRDLVMLLQKWSHSLQVLDLSHMPGEFINEMLSETFLPNGMPELESLDVNTTSINISTLKYVIEKSPKLSFLHLELCRSLGRGLKHVYRSRSAIEELMTPEEIDLV